MKKTRILSILLAGIMAVSLWTAGFSASAASLAKVKSLKAVNAAKGVKLTWKKVKGAKTYKVIRGKKVIKTVKKTTFTDTKAKAGKSYTYKVQAVGGKVSAAVKLIRLKAPVISKIKGENGSTGSPLNSMKISWKKSAGAKKYFVYRKLIGKYKKIATVSALSYKDNTIGIGPKYIYKVKAVNGKSVSLASAGKAGVIPGNPDSIKVTQNGEKIVLKWNKIQYATSYKIFDADTDKVIKKVKTNSCTLPIEESGIRFVAYYVRAYTANGNSFAAGGRTVIFPEGSHYRDNDNNIHVVISLKEGESFTEASRIYSLLDDWVESIAFIFDEGTDTSVAVIKQHVITGISEGESVFTVNYYFEEAEDMQSFFHWLNLSYNNEFPKEGVAYLHVKVTK